MFSGHPSQQIAAFLARLQLQPAVLVQVQATQGSAPRDAGSWMAVFENTVIATIGGGHLEHEAIARARGLLQSQAGTAFAPQASHDLRFTLGPSLGQCCGGTVNLRLEHVSAQDAPGLEFRLKQALMRVLQPVALFGGGHVGHALARVLSRLPFALTWIDSRDGIFPEGMAGAASCEHSDPVHGAVPGLASRSRVLIMSFSHAEDLDVVAACLQRQRERSDLPYIGLIGSRTKWATFRKRLEARGFTPQELAFVTSPIGVSGIHGKEPEVVAVAVAAQLLQTF